ncbi:MAG: Periplasmic beta-glucosidase, partial [Bryobacterales bacterium]|nr:Periplasmic beta-glucosidase [Bryobacterales bacterium]
PGGITTNHDELLAAGKIGSLFNATTALQTNTYQKIAVEKSRLHIPVLFGLDVIHGFRTIFPVPLGLAATWNIDIVERCARVAAEEASAQGIRWTFSPMVDVTRDARWGRIIEGAGEDPYLGSLIARAYVRGYQGKALNNPSSILACTKHFVGYGAAEAGREYNATEISERLLRQVYLPPFRAALDEGAATFMSAFNSLNEVPTSANPFTLTEVLRNEWAFKGFVVSDYNSIREIMAHGIANDEPTAARKSFLAGVDMDMEGHIYLPNLVALVRSGVVPEGRVDDAVRRILQLKFTLGLFDHPYVDAAAAAHAAPTPEHLAVAREAAEESFVLLRNDGTGGDPVLPLRLKAGGKIALIGPLAVSADDMLGSWAAVGNSKEVVSLHAALSQRAVQNNLRLRYAKGAESIGASEAGFAEALEAARSADVIVAALGERAIATGEGSARSDLDLPAGQQKLLEQLVATAKPVVLVLFSGRPLTISWAATHVPAILQAWFPGLEAGPALVRTLFGDANPSGRLTVSYPRSVGQEPLYYNALSTGRPLAKPDEPLDANFGNRYFSRYIDEKNSPLFPFGYGLSYTTFGYSDVKVSASTASAAALNLGQGSIVASAEITNTGGRAGVETIQLYIRLRGTSVARPVRELKGYQRVKLEPGERRRVEFRLGRDELKFWNIDMKDIVEPAALSIWIAPNSASGSATEVQVRD